MQLTNDVRFWLGQDMEHNLFFALGFEDPELRAAAQRLHDAYQTILARDDLGAGLRLLETSQAFKLQALAKAERGWVGWIFPLFIDHTRREMDMMLARIRPGGVTSREELCFMNRIGQEHCAFAAHLLDPSEKGPHDRARLLELASGELANGCAAATYGTLLALSKKAGSRIDALFSGLDLAKTRSVIHPVLAAHVVREGRRFVGTMRTLPTTG